MKMKDVIQKTGLTRKTVLYYEEQGLLTSEKTPMNGREYREYTDDHIQLLLDIAALRKAGFSIEEIRTMQHADSEVRPIFLTYRQRLAVQKESLEQLLQTAAAIPENSLDTMQSSKGSLASRSILLINVKIGMCRRVQTDECSTFCS